LNNWALKVISIGNTMHICNLPLKIYAKFLVIIIRGKWEKIYHHKYKALKYNHKGKEKKVSTEITEKTNWELPLEPQMKSKEKWNNTKCGYK
jgi:hypothetical protein